MDLVLPGMRHPSFGYRERVWEAHEFEEYRLQGRGGKGIITIKTNERNGRGLGRVGRGR